MNGGRGAKGSANDRVISFLFRKRYLEYLKKKESYTVEEREKAIEYLKKIKYLDIESDVSMLDEEDRRILDEELIEFDYSEIQLKETSKTEKIKDISNSNIGNSQELSLSDFETMKEMGKNIQEYDPLTEQYDFENYDYYELITSKGGLSKIDSDDIIDVDKEIAKKTDEKTILEEVKEFIDESKKDLYDMKFEIEFIKSEIDKQYTQEQIKELKERYDKVNKKLKDLRKKYHVIKEKYEFEGYEILDNLTLIESVDDYKTKADLEELELMVEACRFEVDAIDGVVIEYDESKKVGTDIIEKKNELVDRDNEYDKSNKKTIYLSDLEKIIKAESVSIESALAQLKKDLANVQTEVVHTRELVYNTNRLFGSFLRVVAGILTAPISGIFGIALGSILINRGIRGIRESLIPHEEERIRYIDRYRDVEREINNAKTDVEKTLITINSSLDEITDLKKIYIEKFEPYAAHIPEFSKLKNTLLELEKSLKDCKEKVEGFDKTLDENSKENKIKVYNSNHPRDVA